MVGGNGSHVVAGRAHVGAGVLLPHHRDLECRALGVNTTLTEKVAVLEKNRNPSNKYKVKVFLVFLSIFAKLSIIKSYW